MLCHSLYIFLTRQEMLWMKLLQHLNQYIKIYLHRECHKTSFICCFVVTIENLLWLVVFYFSVHDDQQRNNIYLQRCRLCWSSKKSHQVGWIESILTSLIRKISNIKRYPVEKPSNEISSLESIDMLQSENFI